MSLRDSRVKDILIQQICERSFTITNEALNIYFVLTRGSYVTKKRVEKLHEKVAELELLTGDLAK